MRQCCSHASVLLAMPPGTSVGHGQEADDQQARERWAMAKLDRMFALRKAQKTFWEVVVQARQKLLDSTAISAGAEEGQFYTDSALMIRESLRTSPQVEDSLEAAWLAVLQAKAHSTHKSPGCTWQRVPDAENMPTSIGIATFRTMIRKLYLIGKHEESDFQVDAIDCLRSITSDWQRDSAMTAAGRLEMNKECFKQCWFEIADLHTASCNADDYKAWIDGAIEQITATVSTCSKGKKRVRTKQKDDGGSDPMTIWRERSWQDDKELLDGICDCIPMPTGRASWEDQLRKRLAAGVISEATVRERLFRQRRQMWETTFGLEEELISSGTFPWQDSEERVRLRSAPASQTRRVRSSRPSDARPAPASLPMPNASKVYWQARLQAHSQPSHRKPPVAASMRPNIPPHRSAPTLTVARRGAVVLAPHIKPGQARPSPGSATWRLDGLAAYSTAAQYNTSVPASIPSRFTPPVRQAPRQHRPFPHTLWHSPTTNQPTTRHVWATVQNPAVQRSYIMAGHRSAPQL